MRRNIENIMTSTLEQPLTIRTLTPTHQQLGRDFEQV